MRKEATVISSAVETLEEAGKRAPKLFGIPTGVEGLDNLFFTTRIEDGKPKKVPLGGIPYLSVVNITGVSDTGKSLMAEQFAVKQASMGYPVCFVTVESPSPFVASALKERAKAMGLGWEEVERFLKEELREELSFFRPNLFTYFLLVGGALLLPALYLWKVVFEPGTMAHFFARLVFILSAMFALKGIVGHYVVVFINRDRFEAELRSLKALITGGKDGKQPN
jgi:hypothetical protein